MLRAGSIRHAPAVAPTCHVMSADVCVPCGSFAEPAAAAAARPRSWPPQPLATAAAAQPTAAARKPSAAAAEPAAAAAAA